MIEIKNGYKQYDDKIVLKNFSYQFENGKIYGLIGPNGSGKTIVLKAITGYIKLTKGEVLQDNSLIRKDNNYIKNAGIIIETPNFISDFTVKENLEYLKTMSKNKEEIDLKKWYKVFNIEEFENIEFAKLSLGTKQKLGLIQAFMHNPSVFILDEPFNALDKKSIKILQDLLLKKKEEGKLVIISTHINDNFLKLCDEIIEMYEGEIIDIKK